MLVKVPFYNKGDGYINISTVTAFYPYNMTGFTREEDKIITQVAFTSGQSVNIDMDIEEFVYKLSRYTDIY